MNIPGFTQTITQQDNGCFGIFGGEGSGKTHLCCTATDWALERSYIPAWIICDRKTRKTVRDYHALKGLALPLMNQEDFLTQKQAIALATNNNFDEVRKAYEKVTESLLEAVKHLAETPKINPIVVDSGTWVWDAISFSHFGRKQEVGRARVWGPPKQDFTDMMDAMNHKLVLVTLKAKEAWKDDKATGKQTWDGPPHLGYCTTSVMRCRFDAGLKFDPQGRPVDPDDRFMLDVVESQDNVGVAGMDNVLVGQSITLDSLMAVLGRYE